MNNFYAVNTYTYVDGISLILLAKLLGISLRRKHRNGMLDWRDNFLSIAEVQSWRLYFLGGLPEVAANIRARLQVLYPRLQVRCHHGFDAFQTETTVWKEIGEFSPQIIIVGMGMPLQEQWILEARSRVRTKLFIPCGATFEYLVQVQKPAPRWLGPIGLEWFYRLITGPKTLRRRYLIEPFGLLPLILKELTKRRADGNS